MKNIKFSFIIPCYNVATYLSDNFNSLLNQDLELGNEYEIIYIDDMSTDNTCEILESFKDKDGVRIYRNKENIGVSATRNRGIELAHGELLWFVDSDDFIEPNVLKTLWGKYSLTPNAIGINIYAGAVSYESSICDIQRTTNYGFNINACNYIVSRNYVLTHSIKFPLGIHEGEDQLFVFLLKFYGGYFAGIKDVIYYYRMNPTSLSHTSNPYKHLLNMKAMLKFFYDFKMDNAMKGTAQAMENLNVRIQWTTANICADAIFLEPRCAAEIVEELITSHHYPYPLLWDRLTLKYGIRVLILNIIRLPLCYKWYFKLLNRIFYRKDMR